jgi:hypothetical protein
MPLQMGAMQWAHVRHIRCVGHEVYVEHKLLEIFERS